MKPTIVRVEAQRLTPEAFSPFGIHVAGPGREPDWGASGSRVDGVTEAARSTGREVARLWNLGDLTFGNEIPYVGLVKYFNQGFHVAQLERHVNETQTWIARTGSGYLVVAAATPPGQAPSPDSAHTFLFEPGDMVVIGKGVWMCHFFPTGETAEYAVVTARRAPEQDRDLVDFVKTANTILEIAPAPGH
jgi:ureidoglycolate hydrolase